MSAAASTLAPFGSGFAEFGRKPLSLPGVRRSQLPPQAAATPQATHPAVAAAVTLGKGEQVDQQWAAVVRKCLQGDPLAWTELVRAHHGRVYALCYRFTGSSHDAEDLTQDIFLKVYGSLQAFDSGRGSLSVWVTTMTRNHLVDHYRRSRLQRASDSLDAGWDDAGSEGASHAGSLHLEDHRPGPHAQALQHELEREVQKALATVSPELREAVILRDLQDMDYKEIAAVLRVPEGTVKSRISRGRAELARMLANSGGRGRKQVS